MVSKSNALKTTTRPIQLKCAIFDLDNTLIYIPNTNHYFDSIIQKVMEIAYQLPVPSKEERDTLWRSGKEFKKILQRWGVNDYRDFWARFDEIDSVERKKLIEEDKLVLYDDVVDTLQILKKKGIILALVSNTPSSIAIPELEAYELYDYFDHVLGMGDNQDQCKPEPDGLFMVMKKFNLKAEECIFIGDNSIDMTAAKRANMDGFLIDRSGKRKIHSTEITDSDFTRITDLHQILDLMTD